MRTPAKQKNAPQTQSAPVRVPPKPPVRTAIGLAGQPGGPEIEITDPITTRRLAAALHVKPFHVVGELLNLNIFRLLGDPIEFTIASRVCARLGIVARRKEPIRRDRSCC